MTPRRRRTVFPVLLVLVCWSSWAAAQEPVRGGARLRVTVSDQTGAVIVGARVEVGLPERPPVVAMTGETGQAVFDLPPGRYTIRAAFDGFETQEASGVRVRGRETRRELRLPIARIADELTVGRNPSEAASDPRGDAFSTILSREQIDQLPDDPDDLESALNQMAGPGAVMRVNGFRGGRLPAKSQIQEIRFRRNFYAADTHEPGFISIDIRTRPGNDTFRGSFDFGFRDEAMNGRNAFAPRKGDEQQRRFGVTLEGPLWKNRTSFALSTDGFDSFDSRTIVAALVGGALRDVVRRPADRVGFNLRLEHALTKNHALRAELQRGSTNTRNLGVGDFDLPERAFDRALDTTLFRVSDSGPFGKRLFNELRLQASWQNTRTTPLLEAPAVQVLNAFTTGGAQVDGHREVREIEVADNLDIALGRHTMRTGFLLEGGWYRSSEARNRNGAFTFSSLEAFAAGQPATYTQVTGNPEVAYSQYQFGWYFQDDIRARKDLTVSVGLRHEFQSHLGDWNNFAPRAGLTWSPFKDGSTTFRAGAGIFYDWYSAQIYEQTLRVDGRIQRDVVVRNPGYPDPFSGGTPSILPAGRIQAAADLRMPLLLQASLGVERRLTPAAVLNVAYFDTRGRRQLRGRNVNAPLADGSRPDPTVGNVTQIESTSRSRSRSLSFNLNLNASRRRMFAAVNYTYGFSRNESDGPFSLPADNYDPAAEWGSAPNDVRHRLMGMVHMPLWKQLRLASQFRASSAAPYTITTGFDDNGDTVLNDRPEGVGRNSARGKGQWDVSARLQYTFGFGTRATPAGPGVPQVRIIRAGDDSGPIGGGMMLGPSDARVRLDVYLAASNLFNHVNYTNFTGVRTSPFFGQPTAAQPGRRVEVGVRIGF